ncbi:MAG: hypothetical protein WC378_13930 [Opitutaceae bacterium]|jgi:hypothetical protein
MNPTPTPTPPPSIKYANGQEERLTFKTLSISERIQFVNLLCAGESPSIVALCCDRNLQWVNTLDLGCYNQLIAYFIKANFSTMVEMSTHDPIIGLKVGPLLYQMGNLLKLLPSNDSAPTPAPAAPSGNASPSEPAPAASVAAIGAAA